MSTSKAKKTAKTASLLIRFAVGETLPEHTIDWLNDHSELWPPSFAHRWPLDPDDTIDDTTAANAAAIAAVHASKPSKPATPYVPLYDGDDGSWRSSVGSSSVSVVKSDGTWKQTTNAHTTPPTTPSPNAATTAYKSCTHQAGKRLFPLTGIVDGVPRSVWLTAYNAANYRHAVATCDLVFDLAKPFEKNASPITLPPAFKTAWESLLSPFTSRAPVIEIDWPDYQAPPLKPAFWPALRDAIIRTLPDDSLVGVGCVGGHGRTGTFLTALYMCTHSMLTDDAVEAVRELHCTKAVESKSQLEHLDDLRAYILANATPTHMPDAPAIALGKLTGRKSR